MELIKRNIHMDRVKTEAVTQFTVEDDVNIPDTRLPSKYHESSVAFCYRIPTLQIQIP